jgi:hypothetical protein
MSMALHVLADPKLTESSRVAIKLKKQRGTVTRVTARRLVVSGSIPELGGFDAERAVAMERSVRDAREWVAAVTVPFAESESATFGLFELRFGIEVAVLDVPLGGGNNSGSGSGDSDGDSDSDSDDETAAADDDGGARTLATADIFEHEDADVSFVWEPYSARRIDDAHAHQYFSFRAPYMTSHYGTAAGGYYTGAGTFGHKNPPFATFLRLEINRLRERATDAGEFVDRFLCMEQCLMDSRKTAMEAVLDDVAAALSAEIEECVTDGRLEDIHDTLHSDLIVGLLGMIGTFAWPGIRSVISLNKSTSTYGAALSATWAVHSPEPKNWCFDMINVLAFLCNSGTPAAAAAPSFVLSKTELGTYTYEKTLVGLRETVERVYFEGSFDWLALTPLLLDHKVTPGWPGRKWAQTLGNAALAAEFDGPAATAIEAAIARWEVAASAAATATATATATASATVVTDVGDLAAIAASHECEAADKIIGTVIEYSPAISSLARLLDGPISSGIASKSNNNNNSGLGGAGGGVRFCDRVGSFLGPIARTIEYHVFVAHVEFTELVAMLQNHRDSLLVPRISAAVLQADEADDIVPEDEIWALAVRCLESYLENLDDYDDVGDSNNIDIDVAVSTTEPASNSDESSPPAAIIDITASPKGGPRVTPETVILGARSWLRRNYGGDPLYEYNKEMQAYQASKAANSAAGGGGGTGWSSSGWYSALYDHHTVAKPKVLSHEEKVRKTVGAMMAAAAAWERVLNMAPFADHARSILFELERCPFFKGDPLYVLEASCRLRGSLGRYTEAGGGPMLAFVDARCSAAVDDAELTTTAHVVDIGSRWLLGSTTRTPGAAPLFASLVDRLLSRACGGAVALDRVLAGAEIWDIAFRALATVVDLGAIVASGGETTTNGGTDVVTAAHAAAFAPSLFDDDAGALCACTMALRAREALTGASARLAEGQCPVAELKVVLGARSDFLALVTHFGTAGAERLSAALDDQARALRELDATLDHARCFCALFCGGKVRIDASGLRDHVREATDAYEALLPARTASVFDTAPGLSPGIEADAAWLHALRTSELFLEMWNAIGAEQRWDPQYDDHELRAAAEAEAARVAAAERLAAEVAARVIVDPLTVRLFAELPSSAVLKRDPARTCKMCDAQFPSRNMLFDHIRAAGEHGKAVDAPLPPRQVHEVVVPLARAAWGRLRESVRSGSIGISELESTFARLTAPQVDAELALLWAVPGDHRTQDGPGSDGDNGGNNDDDDDDDARDSTGRNWVERARDRIGDFLYARRVRVWLPAIISFCADLANSLFEDTAIATAIVPAGSSSLSSSTSASLEVTLGALCTVLAKLDDGWLNSTLADIPALVTDARPLLAELSIAQLDILAELASGSALLDWLLRHDVTDEFNRLLTVIRSSTDEPRLLGSIASLVHVRTALVDALYPRNLYGSVQAFVRQWAQIDAGDVTPGYVFFLFLCVGFVIFFVAH